MLSFYATKITFKKRIPSLNSFNIYFKNSYVSNSPVLHSTRTLEFSRDSRRRTIRSALGHVQRHMCVYIYIYDSNACVFPIDPQIC